jgi:hypothetical protein
MLCFLLPVLGLRINPNKLYTSRWRHVHCIYLHWHFVLGWVQSCFDRHRHLDAEQANTCTGDVTKEFQLLAEKAHMLQRTQVQRCLPFWRLRYLRIHQLSSLKLSPNQPFALCSRFHGDNGAGAGTGCICQLAPADNKGMGVALPRERARDHISSLIPAEIAFSWPQNLGKDFIPYSSRNGLLLATEPRQGWMPRQATSKGHGYHLSSTCTSRTNALKQKVSITLHLTWRAWCTGHCGLFYFYEWSIRHAKPTLLVHKYKDFSLTSSWLLDTQKPYIHEQLISNQARLCNYPRIQHYWTDME